ncbi:uncharacterized protein PV09_07808, partial [Verruconis gallopava]
MDSLDFKETRFGTHTSTEPYSGGHPKRKSGTIGGAGHGNKSAPKTNMDEYDNSELRFGSHNNTEPYSGGHHVHKSGSVGGAGFGNKTGTWGEDSRMGKVMEKIGQMTHNEDMVEKGRAKREAKGFLSGG